MMFQDMKPYPKYADTESPWLRRVPAHWSMPRLKSVVREVSHKGYPDEPLLAATQSRGVIRKDQYENRTVEATKSLETLKLVHVDDFVISLRSFQGGIERAHAQGIISPAYTILRANEESSRDYLTLLFKSLPFIDALRLAVTGIREGQNVEYPRLAREPIPVPPADEQRAIVRYLAHAHNRIGRAIRNKQKLASLLGEQREIRINWAVVRGVDSAARLRSTGNRFIGEVPEHWETCRLSWVTRPVQRTGFATENLLSVYLGRGVIPYDEGGKRVHAPSTDLTAYQLVEPGDLVLNNQQAWRGSVGVSDKRGIVSPAYLVAKVAGSLDTAYARFLFAARPMVDQYVVASKGVGDIQRSIHWPYLRNAQVPIPPLAEQRAIVDHLDKALSRTDSAIAKVVREIALLQEFRTRLTAEVVTGQVDVRSIAASLPAIELADVIAASAGADDTEDDETADGLGMEDE